MAKYKSTQDYIQELQRRIDRIKSMDFAGIAAATVVADQAARIYEKGQDSNSQKIGDYNSTKPIYVSPADSPKSFKLEGKPGSKQRKSRKTGYFPSYKAFRNAIGRQTEFIDLKLTGTMASDFRNGLKRLKPNLWVRQWKNLVNKTKASANQNRFNTPIWKATKEERAKFSKIAQQEFNKAFYGKSST